MVAYLLSKSIGSADDRIWHCSKLRQLCGNMFNLEHITRKQRINGWRGHLDIAKTHVYKTKSAKRLTF